MLEDIFDEPYLISDMHPDIFFIILQFIYTNCCQINMKNVMHLLPAAMEYGMSDLVKICEEYIGESITIDTACDAMQAAVTFGLDHFKRTLLSFFEQHAKEIFSSKSFNELSDSTLAYILQSDELTMDEGELLKAVKGWAVVNSVEQISVAWKHRALKTPINSSLETAPRKGTKLEGS